MVLHLRHQPAVFSHVTADQPWRDGIDTEHAAVEHPSGAAGGYTVTDADGAKTTVLLDDNGQLCETIDPLGNVTTYLRDQVNRLTTLIDPLGNIFQIAHHVT